MQVTFGARRIEVLRVSPASYSDKQLWLVSYTWNGMHATRLIRDAPDELGALVKFYAEQRKVAV